MKSKNCASVDLDMLLQNMSDLLDSINKLQICQLQLDSQINKLKNVSVREIVKDVLLELNRTEKQNVTSFDDLLVLTAKMALKGSIKKR